MPEAEERWFAAKQHLTNNINTIEEDSVKEQTLLYMIDGGLLSLSVLGWLFWHYFKVRRFLLVKYLPRSLCSTMLQAHYKTIPQLAKNNDLRLGSTMYLLAGFWSSWYLSASELSPSTDSTYAVNWRLRYTWLLIDEFVISRMDQNAAFFSLLYYLKK